LIFGFPGFLKENDPMPNKSFIDRLVFFLLWVIVSVLGWLAGVLGLTSNAKTYLEVAQLIPVYLLNGLLVGLVTGVGQALILRRVMPQSSRWFWSTLLGYALAFPAGLLIEVLIPSITFPLQGADFLPLSGPSTMTIYLYPQSLFWGSFFVGLVQWPVLKRFIPDPNAKKLALWVLVTWLGPGFGIFVRWFFFGILFTDIEKLTMGVAMGVITGLAFLIMINQVEDVIV
jgi:hypothetical protein